MNQSTVSRYVSVLSKPVQEALVSPVKITEAIGAYEFTSSGILCTNHINCRDQLCVNLDTGELIPGFYIDPGDQDARIKLDNDLKELFRSARESLRAVRAITTLI